MNNSEATTAATTHSGRRQTHVTRAINSVDLEGKEIVRKLRLPTTDPTLNMGIELRSMLKVVRHSTQRAMRRKQPKKVE